MIAWRQLSQGLADGNIEKNYAAEVFLNLEGITASHVIRKCWDKKFTNTDEIVEALVELIV